MITPSLELEPVVVVIDDDADVREALEGLFRSVGLRVALFGSAQAYLAAPVQQEPGCLVLDVRLPGVSGLDFHDDLTKTSKRMPVVFISGHADVAMSVRAMKAGAVDFLTKPVRDQDLLDAVQVAIAKDRERRCEEHRIRTIGNDYSSLTLRERAVLACVVDGKRNKQIAADLSITEATVKLHRSHIMQKLHARSIVDLVRITDAFAVHQHLDESLSPPPLWSADRDLRSLAPSARRAFDR